MNIISYLGGALCPILVLIGAATPDISVYCMLSFIFLGFFSGPMAAATGAISTELYPLHIRGLGTSCAMGMGRIGAAIAPALFGLMLEATGFNSIWYVLVVMFLVAAILTFFVGIETAGRDLEEIGTARGAAPSAAKTA